MYINKIFREGRNISSGMCGRGSTCPSSVRFCIGAIAKVILALGWPLHQLQYAGCVNRTQDDVHQPSADFNLQ